MRAAMVENGTVWVPTLSTVGNLRGKGRFEEDAVRQILDLALQNVGRFAAMGGLVAAGSDAGAWSVTHAMDSEWALLKQAIGPDTETIVNAGNNRIRQLF
jgi:hypothetical protein